MRREFSANVSHELKNPADVDFRLCRADDEWNGASGKILRIFQGEFTKKPIVLVNLVADIIQLSRLDEQQDEVVSMEKCGTE